MTHKIPDLTHRPRLKSLARFAVEVAQALSAGLIMLFAVIVITVAIFPSARDGMVRAIWQISNQGAQ